MIQYIDGQLSNWARWQARRDDMGVGYVQSQLSRLDAVQDKRFAGIPLHVSDEDMHELTQIIAFLPEELRQAVQECYLTAGTAIQHAQACGCSRDTYYSRLHRAHVITMEALQVGWREVDLLVVGYARVKEEIKKVSGLTTKAARVVQRQKFFTQSVDRSAPTL
ncbi:hypothetical protein [Iodobacter fluviatilis]|uniref:Phage antitermination protein Q n=1 Tax=Iodobacter fluviatilis TaxID=537 RepID=A0A7G3GBE2_9NEIS|nr:hypothetical protein [Iodobacter fluviatilis]QBC44454.1 hypothetical protein C1H71_13545 [Iodobacter fluviatilis]